ncbi:MAG: sulfotransferase [Lentimicrobiaceae bacterium]|jgi:sulfotransferase|nr:sulfotransferase [Lentimicrobiaceae bacterium]
MFILAGLPRSGITVLSALLNQNPKIYVTTTSAFVEILWRCYSVWDEEKRVENFNTDKLKKAKVPFLKGMTDSYFSQLTDKPIVIDKCRQWMNIANIEMYIKVYGERPKILCPVRSVDEIVISFAELYIKNKTSWWSWDGIDNWLSGNQFYDSYYQMKEALNSEYKDCFHLFEYDDLVNDTQNTMDNIYKFLEVDGYNHTLNVEVAEIESDWGLDGLHKIRKKISKKVSNTLIPSDLHTTFNEMNFWRVT